MVITAEHPPTQVKPPEPQPEAPPLGRDAIKAQPPPTQEPAPKELEDASLSIEAPTNQTSPNTQQASEIPQPTAAELNVIDMNTNTDAYFAEVSSIVGDINPNATIQEMLILINKKLTEQNKPPWDINDTTTSKIGLALDMARTKAREVKAQVSTPTESGMETAATLENAIAEARIQVNAYYNPDRTVVEEYLTKLHGQPPDSNTVDVEVARRNEALNNHPDLKKAFETNKKAYDITVAAEDAYKKLLETHAALPADQRPPTPDKAKFLSQYYDKDHGLYWNVDNAGNRAGEPIDFNRALGPYMRALQRLAQEKTGEPPNFPPQAKEAQSLLKTLDLDKRLYTGRDGMVILDKSPTAVEKKRVDAMTAADAVSRSITEKAKEIDTTQKLKIKFYMSSLAIWRKELQDLPPDTPSSRVNAYTAIVTTATQELIEAYPEMRNNPALAENLKMLQENTEYYKQPGNDPLSKRVKEIMTHIKYPPEGGNVDVLIQSIGPAKMMLITASLDTAVQADLDHPRPGQKARAAELVDKLLTQGIISGEQGRFLSHLVNQQDVGTFTNTCANELNLSPQKLKTLADPQKYLHDNARTIANMIYGGKATEENIKAFAEMTSLTPEMIAKYVKEHELPMSQIMILLMILPMIQGTLETGGGGGREEQQGG